MKTAEKSCLSDEFEEGRGKRSRFGPRTEVPFPETPWSKIMRVSSPSASEDDKHRAFADLCGSYRDVIYSVYRRMGVPHHDAEDLTTGFLVALPMTFSREDILDLSSLAEKLAQASNLLSAYLVSQLSTATRKSLMNNEPESTDREQAKALLVKDLNKIIRVQSLYQPQRFSNVPLRPETEYYISRTSEGEDLIRFNRFLLEDAFPKEIARRATGSAIRWAIKRAIYLRSLGKQPRFRHLLRDCIKNRFINYKNGTADKLLSLDTPLGNEVDDDEPSTLMDFAEGEDDTVAEIDHIFEEEYNLKVFNRGRSLLEERFPKLALVLEKALECFTEGEYDYVEFPSGAGTARKRQIQIRNAALGKKLGKSPDYARLRYHTMKAEMFKLLGPIMTPSCLSRAECVAEVRQVLRPVMDK